MEIQKPFIPRRGGGDYQTSVGATPVLVEIGQGSEVLCFSAPSTNTGIAFVAIGTSGVVASDADYPLLPGTQVSLGKALDDTHVSIVCPTGTADVHTIGGIGI